MFLKCYLHYMLRVRLGTGEQGRELSSTEAAPASVVPPTPGATPEPDAPLHSEADLDSADCGLIFLTASEDDGDSLLEDAFPAPALRSVHQ